MRPILIAALILGFSLQAHTSTPKIDRNSHEHCVPLALEGDSEEIRTIRARNVGRSSSTPDLIGEKGKGFCAKVIDLPRKALSAIIKMSERQLEDISDYDVWTTHLYAIEKPGISDSAFTLDEVKRTLSAMGVEKNLFKNFSFSHYPKGLGETKIDKLFTMTGGTISHMEEHKKPVEDFLTSLLKGTPFVLIELGEDESFHKNVQFSLFLSKDRFIYR